ncbi:hypothetical protein BH09CHL1_BH09CHL1_16500 [soil metagenome]
MVIDGRELAPDGAASLSDLPFESATPGSGDVSPGNEPAKRSIDSYINVPALLAVAIWSSAGPVIKYALDDFPALAYTAYRPLLAALLLVGFFLARGQSLAVAREDRPRLLIAGVAGMGLSQMLYVVGLARTSVTHSAVILTMSPLIAVLFSAVVFRHLPDRRSFLGLIGGFAGVSLLILSGDSGGDASLLGDVLTFAGASAWIIATTVPAPLVSKYGATHVTTWLLFGVIIVTLPIGAMEIGDTLRNPPPIAAWLSLIYNTVFGMILATILWQKAVQVGGSARTLVYLYLEPIGSIALAALFLGERLDAVQAIGAAIALGGMMLVRKR